MQNKALLLIQKLLVDQFSLITKIGVEIEFYANQKNLINNFIKDLYKSQTTIIDITPEKGFEQYEIHLGYNNLEKIFYDIISIMDLIKKYNFSLAAKPYEDRPGSAIHFNISLHDMQLNNLFYKQDEQLNDLLSYSIGGMLNLMEESMIFFAPNKDSYKRFNSDHNTPSKICWGGNNRTVALRVIKNLKNNVRIEHRVCGADCHIAESIIAILISIYYGINNKIKAPQKIYGNAFDNQYNLKELPKSFEEALTQYNQKKILKNFIMRLEKYLLFLD